MITVVTTKDREDRIAALRRRADALGATDTVYAGAAPQWWRRIVDQAERTGAVLVLDRDGERPMLVLPLAIAEELQGGGR